VIALLKSEAENLIISGEIGASGLLLNWQKRFRQARFSENAAF
jgi:hypothetical protein